MATGWRLLAPAVAALIGLGPVPARAGPATDRVKAAVDRVIEIRAGPRAEAAGEHRGAARPDPRGRPHPRRPPGHGAELARPPLDPADAGQPKQFVELYADLLESSYASKFEA
jgi:hypothetical protein